MRAEALAQNNVASASVALGYRNAVVGTNFTSKFPKPALLAAGYEKVEDLGDPSNDEYPEDAFEELRKELRNAGMKTQEINQTLTALGKKP